MFSTPIANCSPPRVSSRKHAPIRPGRRWEHSGRWVGDGEMPWRLSFKFFFGSTMMVRIRTLALAGGAWAATLNLAACTPSHSAEDPRTVSQLAEVAVAQPAEAAQRAFTGIVSPRVQSNLGFRVSGKVIERLVDSGQIVHQGQPLLRLDRTDYTHGITAQLGNVDARA